MFLFSQFNSVYRINSTVTHKRFIALACGAVAWGLDSNSPGDGAVRYVLQHVAQGDEQSPDVAQLL